MAIKLVSDIHGAHEALASQLLPKDKLIMLGDYANLIDFDTLDGIISDIISKERLMRVLTQVAAGDWSEAEELVRDFTLEDGKYYATVTDRLAESYNALFRMIPCEAYLIFGNNDYPDLLNECANGTARLLNGNVVEIEGLRFGFVAGSPPHKLAVGLPGELDGDTYLAGVAALGPADIICSHVPPSGLGLEYDRVAGRDEACSDALAEYIETHEPALAFHGHIHNPKKQTAILGKTRIINLGFFKQHQKVYTLADDFGGD